MFIESDMFFFVCVVKISMCEENYIITQQNSNMNNLHILTEALSNSDNLGEWLSEHDILGLGIHVAILSLNNTKNNPLGNCYAIIIHSSTYWYKYPQYIAVENGNAKFGTLNCTNTSNLTIS